MLVQTVVVENAAEDSSHPFESGCASGEEEGVRVGGRGGAGVEMGVVWVAGIPSRESLIHSGIPYMYSRHTSPPPPNLHRCAPRSFCTGLSSRVRGGTMPQGPGYLALPTIDTVGSSDSPGGDKDQQPRVVSVQRLGRLACCCSLCSVSDAQKH